MSDTDQPPMSKSVLKRLQEQGADQPVVAESEVLAENLRLKHGLENVFTCDGIQQARRYARSALQEATVGEAADRLGVSRNHLHMLIREGRMQSRRAGNLRLINEREIERLRRQGIQRRRAFVPGTLRTRAIKKCAEWLMYCLEIGWAKADLDELESAWLLCHDPSTGELR